MSVRVLFGYLFLVLGVVLCAYQIASFPFEGGPEQSRLFLLVLLTTVSALLSFLALERRAAPASIVMAFVAFALAFFCVAGCAYCVVSGRTQITPLEYGILFGYAFLFVFIGSLFSIVARGPAPDQRSEAAPAPGASPPLR